MSPVSDAKTLIDILGWVGAGVLIIAYYLVSHGRWSGDSLKYNACNIAASVLVGINAFYHGAIPSVGINVVWVLIGLNALRVLSGRSVP